MSHLQNASFAALLFLGVIGTVLAQGQTTVSVGLDYAEGKYGEPEKSRAWTLPLAVKYESGAMLLKLTVPYVRASGVAAAGGDLFTMVDQTQSGLGDTTASAAWTAYLDRTSGLGVDLGGKIKFATADKKLSLLTTGKNDYSLQADAYRPFGEIRLFASLGWTQKGDPDGLDFRNPWFGSLGFSQPLSDVNTWGAVYDYRQKLTRRGSPISEATLFLTHRYSRQWRVQCYLVGGFSNASPDLGLGTVISYTY